MHMKLHQNKQTFSHTLVYAGQIRLGVKAPLYFNTTAKALDLHQVDRTSEWPADKATQENLS